MTLEDFLAQAVKIVAGDSPEYLPDNALPLENAVLSGDEVLQNVYDHLKEKHPSVEVSFAAADTEERAARMPRWLVAKRDGSLRLRADVEKGTDGLNRFVHKRNTPSKNGQGRIASRYEYDAEAVPAIAECVERVLLKSP